jgi:hypothetical protein
VTATAATCLACGAPLTRTVVDLGLMPLANSYGKPGADAHAERKYPLHARLCEACLLVQVDRVVPAEDLFSDYAYFSSYSDSWLAHCRDYAGRMIGRFHLDATTKVVEIASNDGYLLQYFRDAGVPVLGVDPAANVAAVARERGVPTDVAFFGVATVPIFLPQRTCWRTFPTSTISSLASRSC